MTPLKILLDEHGRRVGDPAPVSLVVALMVLSASLVGAAWIVA